MMTYSLIQTTRREKRKEKRLEKKKRKERKKTPNPPIRSKIMHQLLSPHHCIQYRFKHPGGYLLTSQGSFRGPPRISYLYFPILPQIWSHTAGEKPFFSSLFLCICAKRWSNPAFKAGNRRSYGAISLKPERSKVRPAFGVGVIT